jgi:hypothetical protein
MAWMLVLKFCNWRRDRLLKAEAWWTARAEAAMRRIRIAELRRHGIVK